ncbi:jg7755 [Pararge aegeria aegeria]|uniref:Jg7755 protein n=1 Tax=Pararge aegeria aegeria TaxID=348720 RepID=A0A8S4S1P3_9NEOP|nr:jg7755 [Pararge aegeria aegeria]
MTFEYGIALEAEYTGCQRCIGRNTRALSEARRTTELHRNNCSVQPGRSMQSPPTPPFPPPGHGCRSSWRWCATSIDPAVASGSQMSLNFGPL